LRFADELGQLGELPADLQHVVLAVSHELDEGVPL
jgi:hypothetical protein